MHRWFRFCAALALIPGVITCADRALAQEDSASKIEAQPEPTSMPTPGKHQLRPTPIQIVQHLIEQQGKQIAVQNQQIEHLNRQVEQQGKQIAELQSQVETGNGQLTALSANLNHAVELLEALARAKTAARPATQATPPSMEVRPAQPAERAEPEAEPGYVGVSPGTHVVKKGENLTSIARQHGTTVAELLKLNKIEDERKLQIGQTLLVPPPAATPTP